MSDINDARISNATVILKAKVGEFRATTKDDGTYSLELRPGTYSMEVQSSGFCTLQRAAFILRKTAVVKFDLQMWVCPSDMAYVHYDELEEVAQYEQGSLNVFIGPINFEASAVRRYPAIFTFNLVTVSAAEIVYDPGRRTVTVSRNVSWQDGSKSGTGPKIKMKLDGPDPSLVSLAK